MTTSRRSCISQLHRPLPVEAFEAGRQKIADEGDVPAGSETLSSRGSDSTADRRAFRCQCLLIPKPLVEVALHPVQFDAAT